MTNEEASVIIGNIPIEGDDCYTIAEYQEAKAMAIKALNKALEQQPCEDCISREKVLRIESSSDAYPEEWNKDYERGFLDAINAVLELPSVQPKIEVSEDCISRKRL